MIVLSAETIANILTPKMGNNDSKLLPPTVLDLNAKQLCGKWYSACKPASSKYMTYDFALVDDQTLSVTITDVIDDNEPSISMFVTVNRMVRTRGSAPGEYVISSGSTWQPFWFHNFVSDKFIIVGHPEHAYVHVLLRDRAITACDWLSINGRLEQLGYGRMELNRDVIKMVTNQNELELNCCTTMCSR